MAYYHTYWTDISQGIYKVIMMKNSINVLFNMATLDR
jgi:hypothetical protein